MIRFLLDTTIVSAFAPGKPIVEAAVAQWFQTCAHQLSISAVTVMEIESGIRQYARRGSPQRVANLSAWLAEVMVDFRDRVLPFNEQVALKAGRLEALALGRGHSPGLADIIIAAIGEFHNLTVLTQNLRHFQPLGIPSLNPFLERPEVAP